MKRTRKIVFYLFALLFGVCAIFCVYYMFTKELHMKKFNPTPVFIYIYLSKPIAYFSGTYVVLASFFKFKESMTKIKPFLRKIFLGIGIFLIIFYLILFIDQKFGWGLTRSPYVRWLRVDGIIPYPAIFQIMALLIYFGLCDYETPDEEQIPISSETT